ncbi:MAG: extracellular solute-binding protein [Opitutaceae bacterium]|nr:extracellular solute-binding protein [Opitutaceae bacterium]
MKRPGLIFVLAVAVIGAALAAWQYSGRPARPGRESPEEVVRIGHIFLETQAAIDALGRAYEEHCRRQGQRVRVIQIAVPHRLYASWFITQLLSHDTPEILAIHAGSTTERLARYIEPLGAELARPNPYNAGTPLEGVPWRNTFTAGLRTSYNDTLLDYYSVPFTNTTTRLLVNLDLHREIFGDAPWPGTYEGFVQLCRDTQAYATRTGRKIHPIASSLFHAPVLSRLIVRTQTARLAMRFNPTRTLRYSNTEQSLAWLTGDFSLTTPEVRDQLAMIHELSGLMQPGFTQMGREDADMYFKQGHALTLISFSNSDQSVRQEIQFPLGVVRVPTPQPSATRYGRNILGPYEDKSYTSHFEVGLASHSRHRDRALDFLKFATSQQGNRIFAQVARWTPSVAGVEPHPNLLPYLSDPAGGYQLGFDLACYDTSRAGDIARVDQSNLHLLADARDGAEDRFVRKIAGEYDRAMRTDIARDIKSREDTVQRNDTMIALLDRLAATEARDARALADRRDALWEASLEQEATALLVRQTLRRHPRTPH